MANIFSSRLYLVVCEQACLGRDIVYVTEQAIRGGVDLVQVREKRKDFNSLKSICIRMKAMLARYSVPLIINDSLDMAMVCEADGIHVGKDDIPPSFIRKQWKNKTLLGYSIEYKSQLFNSEITHADYLGISPVFRSKTKTDTIIQWGLEGISNIRMLTDKPLVAIGNMYSSNAFDVMRAGADCIAVVSAICGADDPEKAAASIRNEIEKAR